MGRSTGPLNSAVPGPPDILWWRTGGGTAPSGGGGTPTGDRSPNCGRGKSSGRGGLTGVGMTCGMNMADGRTVGCDTDDGGTGGCGTGETGSFSFANLALSSSGINVENWPPFDSKSIPKTSFDETAIFRLMNKIRSARASV